MPTVKSRYILRRVRFCGTACRKTALIKAKAVIGIFTLYKTTSDGIPKVIGYFEDWVSGMIAVDDDMQKNDEVNVGYSLKKDKEESNGST